ncbi:MAG: hypothetical protein AAF585_19725 [Verrucomicrobiota bacterium]
MKIWLLTMGLHFSAVFTMWPSNFGDMTYEEIFVGPLLYWMHSRAWPFGVLVLGAIIVISIGVVMDRVSTKFYFFSVYTGWCAYNFPTATHGHWWIPILIYTTVALYFWYVWPLMLRQRERDERRDRYG